MWEDKPRRLVKAEQPLFVFQNQIISGNIVRKFAVAFEFAVNSMTFRWRYLGVTIKYFDYHSKKLLKNRCAPVVELADMLDLGSCGVLRAGSSPVTRTTLRRHFWYKAAWEKPPNYRGFFFILAPILVFRATFQLLKSIKLRSVKHFQNNRLHQFLSLQVKKLVH